MKRDRKRVVDTNRIAFFLATSGHSGVDRIMKNLLPSIAKRGYTVDLLRIQGHGPTLDEGHGVNVFQLGAKHVYTALSEVVGYLRHHHPIVMLSDKDRVNRTAVMAHQLANVQTRLALRNGTTVSIDLANRPLFDRTLQRFSMKHLYKKAATILMPSKDAADDFARLSHIPRDVIQVVPSPVVSDHIYRQAKLPVEHPWLGEKTAPIIIGVGELGGRKDFSTLIRAFALIYKARRARLIILGKGRKKEQLQNLVSDLCISNAVDFPGFTPNPYRFMSRSDVFALTSRWEGMPLVLIEALALGIPVVATNCPSGPREILANGKYGPIVPVGDHRLLAKALETTLDFPLPSATLQQAVQEYSLEASTTAYLNAIGLDSRA